MSPLLRNIIAVVAGIIIGSLVNMGIIMAGSTIIAPPEGVDITTTEGLKDGLHLFKPINFLTPFLAHALGTLAGAFVTSKIAVKNIRLLAMLIGLFFLAGGFMMVLQIPSPLWFTVVDLLLAYLPMAWLGYKIAAKQ
ncbi:MAG: hypothetical protein ACK5NK_03370 [Niabella sp.]